MESKEQFRKAALSAVREEPLELPELTDENGKPLTILVRGLTVRDSLDIQEFAHIFNPITQEREYNPQNDKLMTFIKSVKSPSFTLEDTDWLMDIPSVVMDKVMLYSLMLSGRTEKAYDGLKRMMRENPILKRLYLLCVNKLGRLPSELSEVSESEFMAALAALEIEAEDIAKATE